MAKYLDYLVDQIKDLKGKHTYRFIEGKTGLHHATIWRVLNDASSPRLSTINAFIESELITTDESRHLKKLEKIEKYCGDNDGFMWSASVLAIMYDCDFRESAKILKQRRTLK